MTRPDPAPPSGVTGFTTQQAGDEEMLDKSRQSLEAGATGLIFGRNVWQRPHDESLRFVDEPKSLLAKYPRIA